jgi:hypothetical protein
MTVFPIPSLAGAVILELGYGYEVQSRNDRKIDVARKLLQLGSRVTLPGALLINDLPFCGCSPLVMDTLG